MCFVMLCFIHLASLFVVLLLTVDVIVLAKKQGLDLPALNPAQTPLATCGI